MVLLAPAPAAVSARPAAAEAALSVDHRRSAAAAHGIAARRRGRAAALRPSAADTPPHRPAASRRAPTRAVAAGAAQQHGTRPSVAGEESPLPGFASVAIAAAEIAAGRFVVVMDDESRENEGDLIIAADKMTPEAMAFMVRHTSGVVCVALEGPRADSLGLPLMVPTDSNRESMSTAFTVTVDLVRGTSTGISARDRSATVRGLADSAASAADFRRPGHVFPLRYREGGVLVRPGHTEASVDLARIAGCAPVGVLCELVDHATGEMMRLAACRAFAADHGLVVVAIADLRRYLQRAAK